ncbi:unnamed protein product [Ceratitis capitata]|uniref:(Mediterranean fruit fly) hypothetical protein n=1 Tax=Ceratitis capitata TaxID=7213 RepID=A0A811UTF8_CERCA|nr:unnamed protein product [Ceratitis capitata]
MYSYGVRSAMSLLFSCALATNYCISQEDSTFVIATATRLLKLDPFVCLSKHRNYLLASCQIIDMTTRSTLPKNTPSAQIAEQHKISLDIDRRHCQFAKSSPAGESQYLVFVC